MERERPRRAPRPAILMAVVATIAALMFASSLGGGFIYDDNPLIAHNPWVHSLRFWPRWFTSDFWDTSEELKRFGYRMIYWRPGVTASYAVDWQIGRGSPVIFHVTNLVWHAVASALAFLALRRWMGSLFVPFLAALFFAVHPTKAESVAWIAGRTDILCLVGMLTASEGFARRVRDERGGLFLEIAGTALAYLTKEQAIVIPAFVAIEAWVARGRPAIDLWVLERLFRASLPQLGVALAYVAGRSVLLPIRPATAAGLPFGARGKEVLETMGHYAELTFAPHDLSVQQALVRTTRGLPVVDPHYVVLGALFVVALVAAAYAARRKIPGVTMGITLFAVTILPTSNIVPTAMMTLLSERFLYVPVLGIAVALGCALERAIEGGIRVPVAVAAFMASCGGVVALGAVAAARSSDFADEERFWQRELALHPESLEAIRFAVQRNIRDRHFSSALALAAQGQEVAARWHKALGFELDFILQGVEIFLAGTPDHDVDTLRKVDDFLAEALDPSSRAATLDAGDMHVVVPLEEGIVRRRVTTLMPRFLGLRAEIASRFGDDDAATGSAEAAISQCPGCADLSRIGALVEARAGRYEQASRVLDVVAGWTGDAAVSDTRELVGRARAAAEQAASSEGPLRLHFRATELATLEAWGRAFEVLAPHEPEIAQAPNFAIGFAELAWRAGEFGVAREVLSKIVPPERAKEATLEWSRKMGWVEGEVPSAR